MPSNTKFFAILIFVVAVVGGGGFKIHQVYYAPERVLNKIVEPMIKDISRSKWSGDALRRYATPEFQKWMITNNVTNGMPGFSMLGNVKKYIGIQQLRTNEEEDAAALVSEVQFTAGTAYVILQLSKRNGRWLIYSFNIESPLFKAVPEAKAAK